MRAVSTSRAVRLGRECFIKSCQISLAKPAEVSLRPLLPLRSLRDRLVPGVSTFRAVRMGKMVAQALACDGSQ
jgi:hypothetical protein